MNQIFNEPETCTPLWSTPVVVKIAGIDQQVLLRWRRDHHFLGGSREGAQGMAGYMHDLLDTLVTCATADIVRRGIAVESAIMFEADLRSTFERMIEGKGWPSVIGLYPKGRDEARVGMLWTLDNELTIAEALSRSPSRCMLMIDLKLIMDRVLHALKLTL